MFFDRVPEHCRRPGYALSRQASNSHIAFFLHNQKMLIHLQHLAMSIAAFFPKTFAGVDIYTAQDTVVQTDYCVIELSHITELRLHRFAIAPDLRRLQLTDVRFADGDSDYSAFVAGSNEQIVGMSFDLQGLSRIVVKLICPFILPQH